MPTIDVPGVGPVERKWVYIVGAGAAGIVAYAYWKRRQSSAAPTLDTTTGSLGADSSFANPNPGASGSDSVDVTSGTAVTTNEQWAAKVAEGLDLLYDSQFVALVLGKYLGRQPLTAEEADLIRTAWALYGHPPAPDVALVLTGTGPAPGGTPPPSSPPPSSPPPSSPPAGAVWVDIAKYTTPNPPWNSTLSGIAAHYHTSVSHLLELNRGNPSVKSANLIIYPGRVRVA